MQFSKFGPLQRKIIRTKDKLKSVGYTFSNFLSEAQLTVNLIGFAEDAKGNRYALKFSENPDIRNEYDNMKLFTHPNIMGSATFFEIDNLYYGFAMPEAVGGDVFDYRATKEMTQQQIQFIMRSTLTALDFIHKSGHIHRDVKVENMFIKGKTIESGIALGDLEFITSAENPIGYLGTNQYKAPELIAKKKYGTKVDIWAAGISMYFLYFKRLPPKITKDSPVKVNIPSTLYGNLPFEAKDLIRNLLCYDQDSRFTAEQALEHDYFKLDLQENEPDFCATVNEIATIVESAQGYLNKDDL